MKHSPGNVITLKLKQTLQINYQLYILL